MKTTICYCPKCGSDHVKVSAWDYDARTTKFMVECELGHVSIVHWPTDEHDSDCECEACEDMKGGDEE